VGAVIFASECQPDAHDILGVYRARQPSMTHIATMAAFEDSRFVVGNYALAGQQPIRVAPAYLPYYHMPSSFGAPVCTASGHRRQLAWIERLAKTEAKAGHKDPPIYFLLILPPTPGSLVAEAKLVARGAKYELYAIAT
jgi:hypothetical protein